MFKQQENTLWVESFRPDTLEGYIGNEHIIEKVKIFIENGDRYPGLREGDIGNPVRGFT